MDCEKFESTLLDELYDELDEVTSAAAKRHVSGCSRCASLMSGLKATRRMAVLPIVEPPADLEDRILLAAREAQRVAPLTRRASRAISWAGSWAMRPQTGMAAVFLLGIGLSALLLQGKHATPPASMTVSDQGEPVASVAADTLARPPGATTESKAASPQALAFAPVPQAAATAAASAGEYRTGSALDGLAERARSAGGAAPVGRLGGPAKGASGGDTSTPTKALGGVADGEQTQNPGGGGAGAPLLHSAYGGGAQAQAALAPPAAPVDTPPANPLPAAPPPVLQAPAGPATFAGAMSAYRAGDYPTATRSFDLLGRNGDTQAALWAARSVREGTGCANAAPRFDQVAAAAAGTTQGYDATFEGARCYRQLGQLDAAQKRFNSLLTVSGYVDRAKNELAAMGPKAAAKAAAKPPPPTVGTSAQPAQPSGY